MNWNAVFTSSKQLKKNGHPPIGIVLARSKDELLVKYAMHNISSQLFVTKYQLYLPNKEELRKLLEQQLGE